MNCRHVARNGRTRGLPTEVLSFAGKWQSDGSVVVSLRCVYSARRAGKGPDFDLSMDAEELAFIVRTLSALLDGR